MSFWSKIGLGAAALVSGGLVVLYGAYRSAVADAQDRYDSLIESHERTERQFSGKLIADLPEIAQRYFRHAVAPGTPLYVGVELEMEGTFLLGDKRSFQSYDMAARQVLRPPEQFVWIPQLRSGAMIITGSDALVSGEAWTRFWLAGLVPVGNARTSPDLIRSAQFRGAVEGALWLPTTLLPENGVRWEQLGTDQARVTLERSNPAIVITLTLAENGAVKEVVGQRWSNANPAQRFQLQPFGGTMGEEITSQGLTIPAAVSVGNHYGTRDYLPFFQARITKARFF